MNSATGEVEKIITRGKYFGLFNELVDLIADNPRIRIDSIINCLKNRYNEEEIRFSLRYLISKEIFVYVDEDKKFLNRKLILDKKPLISLADKNDISEPFIVLTLPPFNYFGLKSSLESHHIKLNYIKDEIKKLFLEAEESICICSPFLDYAGINDFLELLVFKSRKGVKIRIISRQISPDDRNSRFRVVKPIFEYFRANKCDVEIKNYHYQSKMHVESSAHSKFVVVDGKRAYVGSGELRKNSFEKNFELGIILGQKHSKELNLIFEDIFAISSEVNF